ncbi:MAG TPA: ethanolamine permease, partial [Gammaproteobacteria bacterium]|nr:ethanolamine permease [Gammaproteobacteria bacterium]
AFDPRAFGYTLLLFAAGAAWFFAYSRHHPVARTAVEEFALLAQAEASLEGDAAPAATPA